MAATELAATGAGARTSSDVTVEAGAVVTLIPRFEPGGRVSVEAKDSDNAYHSFLLLYSTGPKDYQVQGPLTFRVRVKNAGCDIDTGA